MHWYAAKKMIFSPRIIILILFQIYNKITKLGIPFSRILHCDPFVFFGREPRHSYLVIREGIDFKRPWPRALAVISGSGIAVRNGTITRAILARTLGALLCRLPTMFKKHESSHDHGESLCCWLWRCVHSHLLFESIYLCTQDSYRRSVCLCTGKVR